MTQTPYTSYSLAELFEEARRLVQLNRAGRHDHQARLAERIALIEGYKGTTGHAQRTIDDSWRKLGPA